MKRSYLGIGILVCGLIFLREILKQFSAHEPFSC